MKETTLETVQAIDLGKIDRHPFNRVISAASAAEMAETLRTTGQITPAIVRPMPGGRYQLIAGERRRMGCELAGITTLQCLVREMTDTQAAEVLLLENLKRQNLTEMEEAHGYDELLKLRDENGQRCYSLEDIAIKVHGDAKATSRVAKVHKLLMLPKGVITALEAGEVSLMVAFQVARIADADSREKAGKEVLSHPYTGKPMTKRETAAHIGEHYQKNLKAAPFDRADGTLVDAILDKAGDRVAGLDCESCPALAKNHPAFADELAKGKSGGTLGNGKGKGESGVDPMTCTSPSCYHLKCERRWERQTSALREQEPGLVHVPLKEGQSWFAPGTAKVNSNAPVVGLEEKLEYMGGTRVDLPKWEKLLKGSKIEVQVACGPDGEPVKVVDKKVALAWLEQTKPELFARSGSVPLTEEEIEELKAQSTVTDTPMMVMVEAAQKKKAVAAKREAELEKLVESEAKRDTMQELKGQISANGLGLEAWQILWAAAITHVDRINDLGVFMGLDVSAEDWVKRHGLHRDAVAQLPMAQVAALTALALVWDDWIYSGAEAEQFVELSALYGVDHKETRKRVRKAHELAEKQRVKAEVAEEKEAASKGRKNSTDPKRWNVAEEAEKAAAADAVAREGGETGRQGEEQTLRGGDTEVLVSCEVCGRGNFTVRGLKAHVCKMKKSHTVTDVEAWVAILMTTPVPPTEPNEHGVFADGVNCRMQLKKKDFIGISLACNESGQWAAGHDYQLKPGLGGGVAPQWSLMEETRKAAILEELEQLAERLKAHAHVVALLDAAINWIELE